MPGFSFVRDTERGDGLSIRVGALYRAHMNANPFRWSFRAQFLLGAAVCAAALAFAIYTQLRGGLIPCPLCIFQRIAFAGLGVVLLIGGLHAPHSSGGRRIYGALALIAAAIGAGIAGRHVWIQHLPADQVPSCGPGLDYMRDMMPLTSVIRKVLIGSGECARVDWRMLGMSMAEWSLLCFVALAAWVLYAAFRRR